jgi:hypothetical protein
MPKHFPQESCARQGLPNNMKVKAHSKTGVSKKTVDELRARRTWPADLVVTTPRELKPKSVAKISHDAEMYCRR